MDELRAINNSCFKINPRNSNSEIQAFKPRQEESYERYKKMQKIIWQIKIFTLTPGVRFINTVHNAFPLMEGLL